MCRYLGLAISLCAWLCVGIIVHLVSLSMVMNACLWLLLHRGMVTCLQVGTVMRMCCLAKRLHSCADKGKGLRMNLVMCWWMCMGRELQPILALRLYI